MTMTKLIRFVISIVIAVAAVKGVIYFVDTQTNPEASKKSIDENAKKAQEKLDHPVDNYRDKLNQNLEEGQKNYLQEQEKIENNE
jgi:type III secretory pathway component EscR